ncbi:MAG TPA: lantibiotic dehydratase [Ktedonobacteraceae bacterium]
MTDTLWDFTPVAMWRRANVPFRELSSLIPSQTCARLDEMKAMQEARSPLKEELLAYLYPLVPQVTHAERQALIALQRDIHNDREPASRHIEIAQNHLKQEQLDVLVNWLTSRRHESQLLQETRETLDHELLAARRELARLALDEEFARGIQLSGAALFQSIESFARTILASSGIPKQLKKKTEESLVSFLYRAALKPSPFASFTQVGVHRLSSHDSAPLAEQSGQVRLVRLSRILLLWMEKQLDLIEECREYLPLRVNNTLLLKGERFEFFSRRHEGSEYSLGGERFVSLPTHKLVQVVLQTLQQGASRRAELIAPLLACDISKQEAIALVERLIELGLLERGLDLPDQEKQYTRRMAEILTHIPGDLTQRCTKVFSDLADIEDEFPQASVKRRNELLAQIQEQVELFAGTLGLKGPSMDEVKSCIYEDVGCIESPRSYDPALFESVKGDLTLLQQLLPLFDEAAIERLGLYEYFSTLYGPEGTCEDILEFYHNFAKLDANVVSSIMQGRGSSEVETIRALRRSFFEYLQSRLAKNEDQNTLSLEKDWVENFVRQFPSFLRPQRSVAYRLQFCKSGEDQCVVLNGAITGHGAPYSRFCDLFEVSVDGESWSLREAIENTINRHSQEIKQLDITTVLGLNINLHPRLTPLELEYPRAKSLPGATGVLHLHDLEVHADAEQRQLYLFSKQDSKPLNLVPLNFIFPAAAPPLYRFLCVFGSIINFRGGFWDRYLAYAGGEQSERSYFPRLQLGNVVLERQTWKYPIKQLSTLNVDEHDEFSLLVAGSNWKNQMGLPAEGFFRITDSAKFLSGNMDWQEGVRNWVLSARRARLRKPHYIDFTNPFLLRILFKQLGTMSQGLFSVQECLPTTDMYAASNSLSSAEELVFELNMEEEGRKQETR